MARNFCQQTVAAGNFHNELIAEGQPAVGGLKIKKVFTGILGSAEVET